MAYHRILINNNPYILRDTGARARVAQAMTAAVRSGGEFVHIPVENRDIEVLVTASTDVVIETVESSATAQYRTVDFDLDWVDFDYPA